MKLSLVVASGVHVGKAIPIAVPQFVIGRDPQCQLRPASPSISKRHCAILVRGAKVLIRDFGSTNGTFVNDKLVEGEVAIKDGDAIKVGPLDFKIALSLTATPPKSAPQPAPAVVLGGGPNSSGDTVVLDDPPADGPSSDKLAEMLLLDDDDGGRSSNILGPDEVPDGSTIINLPASSVPAPGGPTPPPAKKPVVGTGNTSDAAAEILKRYQRRPRSN